MLLPLHISPSDFYIKYISFSVVVSQILQNYKTIALISLSITGSQMIEPELILFTAYLEFRYLG